MDLLPTGSSKTVGVLDLGGASTQIACSVDDASVTPNISSRVTLFHDRLNLFSDSYLCYGVKEARNQMLAQAVKVSNSINILKYRHISMRCDG